MTRYPLAALLAPFHRPTTQSSYQQLRGNPQERSTNKWHLILDMSTPLGFNVGIRPEDFPLQYIHVDDIIKLVCKYGRGALMAKFDVESAYRNIAVNPSNRYLLGMKWRGMFYVDLTLPSGLRSAPYIFNSIADLVEWMLINNYNIPVLLHYLDDYITAGSSNSPQCHHNLSTAASLCATLGLPFHPAKFVGPTTCLVALGIELDSVNQVARLPTDKLSALNELLQR